MSEHVIAVDTLPPEGKTFILEDQDIWLEPMRSFAMDCTVKRPLRSTITVVPSGDGCLVRGSLTGEVQVPCNRCAEDAVVELDAVFEEFEEGRLAEDGDGDEDDEAPPDSHLVFVGGMPVLDLAAICWEQFVLAMPMIPLCSPGCKGLCPRCGANLNTNPCTCRKDEADPRLAALQNLKIKR
jgi:uncharacterized protein